MASDGNALCGRDSSSIPRRLRFFLPKGCQSSKSVQIGTHMRSGTSSTPCLFATCSLPRDARPNGRKRRPGANGAVSFARFIFPVRFSFAVSLESREMRKKKEPWKLIVMATEGRIQARIPNMLFEHVTRMFPPATSSHTRRVGGSCLDLSSRGETFPRRYRVPRGSSPGVAFRWVCLPILG